MAKKISTATYAQAEAPTTGSRKRLFVGLILGTSLAVFLLLFLLWYIPYLGLRTIHPLAPAVAGGVFLALALPLAWGCVSLVLNILLGRSILFSRRLRGLTIKLFLPLMTLFGRFLGIPKEHVRNSFIKVNNELVLSEHHRYRPDQILLLMPHCLQWSKCDMRLTYDINNCKRCGKCPIKGLLGLSEVYGVHLAIATGGTIARRIVVQTRPRMIIAVACERDLSSGIQDTYPLPAYGVLNQRPHGPCLDTTVSLADIEAALARFIQPDLLPELDEHGSALALHEKALRAARKAAREAGAGSGSCAACDGACTAAEGDGAAVPGDGPALGLVPDADAMPVASAAADEAPSAPSAARRGVHADD
ncbi:MAG: DUF116 domain-containing protein [Desulfovibrionaceae bacterium]|jgi:hypothetical protein|nr:DUF116 domain-containing protein [Desulfovibrionaceae bacterium]